MKRTYGGDWVAYGRATAIVALCTAVAWVMCPYFDPSNLIMVYLLGVTAVAARSGPGPSALASVLSVAAFDFFFVPPHLTFAVADAQYLVTFAVMLVVALVISGLTMRVRTQAEAAQEAQVRAEAERLRSSLLSSVSHDLRTPLATITGAASSLLEGEQMLNAATRRELLETLSEEAERLNRLVSNLLEMTRLESGTLQAKKEWHSLEEVVGVALGRLAKSLGDRPVSTHLPADLPLVPIDDILLEQVLINLLDNAIKHTPDDSPLEIAAWAEPGAVTVEVADRGPGLAPGDEERVFERFYRGPGLRSRGAGLGLAICQGIVAAHGGRIWAGNRPGGGMAFRFTISLGEAPPELRDIDG